MLFSPAKLLSVPTLRFEIHSQMEAHRTLLHNLLLPIGRWLEACLHHIALPVQRQQRSHGPLLESCRLSSEFKHQLFRLGTVLAFHFLSEHDQPHGVDQIFSKLVLYVIFMIIG